ncbi:MAG: DUF1488 domain-containing protein [Pseudorhodoplanes sp.]|nr:MAG: DUF1488 domain-containing protein [Pseudorhodoplanes sp.]
MTIGFPNASRSYDGGRRVVRFWGHDKAMETSFFITSHALQRIEPGAVADEEGLLAVFDRNRSRICDVAAKLYERDRKGSYELDFEDF